MTRWEEGHNWTCRHCHQREYAHAQGYCPPDAAAGRAVELETTAKYLRSNPEPPRRVLLNAAMLLDQIAYEALYRFAQETAAKADRLPDWKKPESPWHDEVSQQVGAARRLLTPVPLDDAEQDDDPDYGL